jgi:hypothetical protein
MNTHYFQFVIFTLMSGDSLSVGIYLRNQRRKYYILNEAHFCLLKKKFLFMTCVIKQS